MPALTIVGNKVVRQMAIEPSVATWCMVSKVTVLLIEARRLCFRLARYHVLRLGQRLQVEVTRSLITAILVFVTE